MNRRLILLWLIVFLVVPDALALPPPGKGMPPAKAKPEPSRVGRIVPTRPLSPEARRNDPGFKNYKQWKLERAARAQGRWIPHKVYTASNTANKTTRARTGRSATSVNSSTTGAPPAGWSKASSSRSSVDTTSITAGKGLRSTANTPFLRPLIRPLRLQPGQLRLSRHITRESVTPGLGRVVPNPPYSRSSNEEH